MQMRILLVDRETKSAIYLRDYILQNFNAKIEWGSNLAFVREEIKQKFAPNMVIVGDILNENAGDADEFQEHRLIVEWMIANIIPRPYMISLTRKLRRDTKRLRRFVALSREFGYDFASIQGDLTSAIIQGWMRSCQGGK